MLTYLAGGGAERITIAPAALAHMRAHRQLCAGDAEAGGQLFAQLASGCVDIVVATGPHSQDRRSRFYFAPDRIRERREITKLHREGLHYVGDWHTHPEPAPTPSALDLRNICQIFTQSRHTYAGILMVIVGQAELPDGLFVGIANAQQVKRLYQISI